MAACPAELELETQEAYRFLRESAPLLEQNGFESSSRRGGRDGAHASA